jgi:hypothetical protein
MCEAWETEEDRKSGLLTSAAFVFTTPQRLVGSPSYRHFVEVEPLSSLPTESGPSGIWIGRVPAGLLASGQCALCYSQGLPHTRHLGYPIQGCGPKCETLTRSAMPKTLLVQPLSLTSAAYEISERMILALSRASATLRQILSDPR